MFVPNKTLCVKINVENQLNPNKLILISVDFVLAQTKMLHMEWINVLFVMVWMNV